MDQRILIDETDSSYAMITRAHMLKVLDVILNKSYHKLGFQNGKGKTYEGHSDNKFYSAGSKVL
ncbi:MAG: hypothetical protein ACLTAI_12275 [Thomasclavelia sp.]